MPAQDGTGPRGMGPRTGRGVGPCGFSWRHHGHHRGLGRYFCWDQPQTKEDQKKALVDYRQALEEELEDIKKEEQELDKAE